MSEEWNAGNILHNLAVRVGQMEGTIKTFMDNWTNQDRIAHESRRVTYDRIELIGKQVERVAVDVQNVQQDVAELRKEIEEEITPTIEAVEQRKHRSAGAKGVWALIGATLIAGASVLAYVADKLAELLTRKP